MKLLKYREFLARARHSAKFWARVTARDFTEDLILRLESSGMKRATLADKSGVSPAYVTKVLRGSENFTIETMAKLALAVGGKVRLHIADLDATTRWTDSATAFATFKAPLSEVIENTISVNVRALNTASHVQKPVELASWEARCEPS